MKKLLKTSVPLFAVAVVLVFTSSCHLLNPNIMLHADRHYKFDTLLKDTTVPKEYTLSPNDVIEFRLFANDGYRLIDIVQGTNNSGGNAMLRQAFDYPLDNEGRAKLPVIGLEKLAGMNIAEAQTYLEGRYSDYYVKPFVMIKVINKRVIVYPGEPGQAKVINIQNNNTTVNEVLALAGGVSSNGKAYNIKLIRKTDDPKKPVKVYKLDLSKIEPGLEQGNTIVQSGDMIYVEPRRQIASKTLKEITPILSLITSLVTFYFLVTRIT